MKKGTGAFLFCCLMVLFMQFCFAEDVIELNSQEDDSEKPSISEYGVEYDSILKLQFLASKWVHVMVDVKDFSNITFSKEDLNEEFEEKINERKNILSNLSDSVLLTLSNDEFKLGGKLTSGRAFYGNITKEGFDKLLKDERVRKIYAKKEIWLNSMGDIENVMIYVAPIILIIVLIILLIKLKKRKWKIKK